MEPQSEQMQASMRQCFFSVRELLIYGTCYVVEASSVNSFKNRLDDWNDVEP